MLSRLKTVLWESYVGHAMCATFLVIALQFAASALNYPISTVAIHFINKHSNSFPVYEPDIDGWLVSHSMINAGICMALSLVFSRWLFNEKKGGWDDRAH